MADVLRPLRFGGAFFPADAAGLAASVARALPALALPEMPRAILSAHAGYRFSGRFTGLAFAAVPRAPKRVVILSPSHRHAFAGIAAPSQTGYDTPLGVVPVDRAALAPLVAAGAVQILDPAHDNEHGIETQLPFVAHLWRGVAVVPLVIGQASPAQVAGLIDALDAPDTLFVLSSDLSHFLPDDQSRAKDAQTARQIELADLAGFDGSNACGARAIAGFFASRAAQGLRPLRLGMGNSAAVTGDRARVVGYGAWAFYGAEAQIYPQASRELLLKTARRAIEIRLRTGNAPKVQPETFASMVQTHAAAFVTLTRQGRLRGCIGSVAAHQPLFADVIANAQKAAFQDARFGPLTAGELGDLHLKIAVLGRAAPMTFADEGDAIAQLVRGQDGLILQSAGKRGIFLPMVWEGISDPAEFLRALKRKAGLPPDHWANDLRLFRFRAETFADA